VHSLVQFLKTAVKCCSNCRSVCLKLIEYELCCSVCRFIGVDSSVDGVDDWFAGSHCWSRRSHQASSSLTDLVVHV